jgi:hypothetical protein
MVPVGAEGAEIHAVPIATEGPSVTGLAPPYVNPRPYTLMTSYVYCTSLTCSLTVGLETRYVVHRLVGNSIQICVGA